jgi:hypothetical protein
MYPRIGQFDGILGPDGEGPGLKPSTAVSSDSSASPVTAAQASPTSAISTYSNTAAVGANRTAQAMPSSTTSSPKAPKGDGIDRSNWNRNVKVSQGVIDDLKKGGIKSAATMSKMNKDAYQGGLVGEINEATNRIYPSAYTKPTTPATKADQAQTDKWAAEDKAAGGKATATPGGTKPTDPKAGATFGGGTKPTTPKSGATFGGGTKPTDPKAGATFGGAAPKVDPKAGTTFGGTTLIPKKTDPKAGATIGGKAPKIGK